MAGISDRALKAQYHENKYRFNDGSELRIEFSDGSGLEAYDANFRMFDPQIGRFWQIDPLTELSEDWSPYAFANDNPILLNDPLGLLSDSSKPQELAPAYVSAAKKTPHQTPDVAAAAGPAPTRVGAPIQSKEEKEHYSAFVSALGYDPNNFQYQQNHIVVRQPSFWDGILDQGDGGKLLGYNFRGSAVRMPMYAMVPTGAEYLMPDGPPGSGAFTLFRNITATKKSITNFRIGMKLIEFESVLAKLAGREWKVIGNGAAKEMIYKGTRYVSRLSTTGEHTVDIYRDGQLLQKYRF